MQRAGARHPDASPSTSGAMEEHYATLNEYLQMEHKFQPRLCLPNESENGEVTTGARDGAAHVMRCLKVWYDLPTEVLIDAVSLFDRFLTKMKVRPCHVPCITVACMNIAIDQYAAQTKEARKVSVEELVSISQSACTAGDVARMSRVVVDKLALAPGTRAVTARDWLRLLTRLLQPHCPTAPEVSVCRTTCRSGACRVVVDKLALAPGTRAVTARDWLRLLTRLLQPHCPTAPEVSVCRTTCRSGACRVVVDKLALAPGTRAVTARDWLRLLTRLLQPHCPTAPEVSVCRTTCRSGACRVVVDKLALAPGTRAVTARDWLRLLTRLLQPHCPTAPEVSVCRTTCRSGACRVVVDKLALAPGTRAVTARDWLRLLTRLLQPHCPTAPEVSVCRTTCRSGACRVVVDKLALAPGTRAVTARDWLRLLTRLLQPHCPTAPEVSVCRTTCRSGACRVVVDKLALAPGTRAVTARDWLRLLTRLLQPHCPTAPEVSVCRTTCRSGACRVVVDKLALAPGTRAVTARDWLRLLTRLLQPHCPTAPEVSVCRTTCRSGACRVVVDKLALAPGTRAVTARDWLRLLTRLLQPHCPTAPEEAELLKLLEIVVCDAACANARTSELALVLLYQRLEQQLVDLARSAPLPDHAYQLFEVGAQLQHYCNMSDASLVSTRGRVQHVLARYEARAAAPQRQRLVWRLSERTLKVLRPTDRLGSLLPTIEEQHYAVEATPNRNRSGSESSENEETSDWPRSPVLPVYCDH
ncbi:uncharacterized protein LOC133532645 [Cydia pomonella]|uniref:uncharacterized protein LOC133532645 n=1 Tax=Cydia pomonella TaxID=82600 RepID=UPI002ADE048D|nr:uncharacterized protein LOC133532645 [Cydia pomonella]XP_061727386.1 uncharacterized protein LOC133532645 [Cydia pomonella]